MCAEASPPSPELLAANERLLVMRARLGLASTPPFVPDAAATPDVFPSVRAAGSLPYHLGWESEAVSRAIRRALERVRVDEPAAALSLPVPSNDPTLPSVPRPRDDPPSLDPAQATLKLYPSLALALLKKEQVACGRVWLLLRYLDNDGRGWVAPDEVRRLLTDKASPFYLFGERQLRKLLAQGEGLFWQRDEGHIWLVGLVRVAAAVGVGSLSGKPVALPVKFLLGSIGDVRAHLYASFHSSRTKTERTGSQSSPISRATLADLSGVSPRTQQSYEKKAGVTVRRNLAVGSPVGVVCAQEQAWRHGPALFPFTDFRGKQGKAGQTYHAWQLPNTYFGPHAHLGRGHGRHHNRQLADLRHRGDVGNGQRVERVRRYFGNGAEVGNGWGKCGRGVVYWPGKKARMGVVVWWVMEDVG